jgi:hypothetical protein
LLHLLACELTWSLGNSSRTPPIHILDDDSLLNVFSFYRPPPLREYDHDEDRYEEGNRKWVEYCWWYELAHVCQRWRNLIFGSASYLGVALVCTKRTPVADMLAHSPSLPLVIDYYQRYGEITTEIEERATLALTQRDRIRRICLDMSSTHMQKLIVFIEEEYPILEYLVLCRRVMNGTTILMIPETLEAPRLRHLALAGFAIPIGSRLLTTSVHLVTLCLIMNSPEPPPYFYPNTVLRWLSFMPQLEMLKIRFSFGAPNYDVEGQLTHPPVMSPVALPNLRYFYFRSDSTYLEELVHRITPCPKKLDIYFITPSQRTISLPRLVQFMNTTENLKFESAKFEFTESSAFVAVYPRGETEMYSFSISAMGLDCDWQISPMAQICNSLRQIFSRVERLTLEPPAPAVWSSEEDDLGVDRAVEWRQLLGLFINMKTLRIHRMFVIAVSCCLRLDDGEHLLNLLPGLQELIYPGSGEIGDPFASFINARQRSGRPVTLPRY